MNKESYTFEKLPFSKLFKTYIHDYSKLSSFYNYNPLSNEDIQLRAERTPYGDSHAQNIKALKSYHTTLGINQEVALKKLENKNALAVVTGQQLGIYGGPLFTIYKTLTTILLAREWESKLGRPVVPVFWLADEDHDFEEIAWVGIPGNTDFKKFEYQATSNGEPVADLKIEDSINTLMEELQEEMPETDFSGAIWDLYTTCCSTGQTFAAAFAQMMDKLFGKHGLLIAGSNYKEIKEIVAPAFLCSVDKSEEILTALQTQSEAIANDFHAQVHVGSTNLFYIDKEKGRLKIEKEAEGWSAGHLKWSTSELKETIENAPESFSPNVFLRPVIQDQLLPTLGYVAGPGEVAYYAQMRELYPHFDLEMPVIFPRFSATLIESGIDRIMDKIPFEFHRYGERIEDLESEYAKKSEDIDVEGLFNNWKSGLASASEEPHELIKSMDGSLDATVGKTVSTFENELNKLKGKVYRSIKQQEQTNIQRIHKIKAQLYPENGLQERMVSFIYFMNKYGIDIWDEIIELYSDDDLELDKHHLIKL